MKTIEEYIKEKFHGSWLLFYHSEIKANLNSYPDTRVFQIRDRPEDSPLEVTVHKIKSKCFDETITKLDRMKERFGPDRHTPASYVLEIINHELHRDL